LEPTAILFVIQNYVRLSRYHGCKNSYSGLLDWHLTVYARWLPTLRRKSCVELQFCSGDGGSKLNSFQTVVSTYQNARS